MSITFSLMILPIYGGVEDMEYGEETEQTLYCSPYSIRRLEVGNPAKGGAQANAVYVTETGLCSG